MTDASLQEPRITMGGDSGHFATFPVRVLIVSRDYDTRTIFATALRYAGFTVHELEDPDLIIPVARDCALVITDFPTMTASGATVTELLRGNAETRSISILNATTHAFVDELGQAERAGVDTSLVLPTYPAQLVDRVRRLLANRR